MHDEADALFEAAAKEAYGDIKIEWIARDGGLDCVLGHSEVYKWDCEAQEAQEERSG